MTTNDEVRSVAGWQPIESAPMEVSELTKCGPMILLGGDGFVESGFYHDGSHCYGHRGGPGWFTADDCAEDLLALVEKGVG